MSISDIWLISEYGSESFQADNSIYLYELPLPLERCCKWRETIINMNIFGVKFYEDIYKTAFLTSNINFLSRTSGN